MPRFRDKTGAPYYVRQSDLDKYGAEAIRIFGSANEAIARGEKPQLPPDIQKKLDAFEAMSRDIGTTIEDNDGVDETTTIGDGLDAAVAEYASGLDETEALIRDQMPGHAHLFDDPPERLKCGARTRYEGNPPCVAPVVRGGKRCRMHGGNAGPKTAEGRARISAAQKRRWEAYRAAKAAKTAQGDGGAF